MLNPAGIVEAPENLDAPLDGDVQVTGDGLRHEISLIVSGEKVSNATILEYRQQIGSQTVKMGGVAAVGTHENHRRKGYSRRVMTNALRWMRQAGFDTSMLLGIGGFYSKFGYTTAFPSINFALAVRDAEAAGRGTCRFVNYHSRYLEPVLDLYRRNNAGRTGPLQRDPQTWKPFRKAVRWGSRAICRVALDERRAPIGYFVYDATPLTPTCIEVGYATPAVFPGILRAMSRIAWDQRLEQINFILPEDHPFMAFCEPLGLRKTVTYRKDEGAMVRMINVPSALRAIAGDLSARLASRGHLDILTNLDNVGLRWVNGKCSIGSPAGRGQSIHIPQWALVQLLYGYRDAAALADSGVLKAPRPRVSLLQELFPAKPHFFYLADGF